MKDNIYESENICNSSDVYASVGVAYSSMILKSFMMRRCQNINYGIFCSDCKASSNIAFCVNLEGEEYYIFNQKVSEEEYKTFKEDFDKNVRPLFSYDSIDNFINSYTGLPESFFDYMKTIKYYDPLVMYSLTFKTDILREEVSYEQEENPED